MPVYHFTLHAYGSWHPDHPQGYHQHNSPGTKKPNPNLAHHRRASQNHPTVHFDEPLQHHLIERTLDACTRRQLRPLIIATSDSHLHAVISWTDTHSAKTLQSTLKRVLAHRCAELSHTQGRKWFSEGGTPTSVSNLEHLNHLLHEYLPGQGGLLWRDHDHIRKMHNRP